jgi:hypothetical protein
MPRWWYFPRTVLRVLLNEIAERIFKDPKERGVARL